MVGKRIKTYLSDHGIMQKFLVEKAGIPSAVLTQILSGNRKIEVSEYSRMCIALNVDFETFLTDDDSEET